MKQLSSAKSSLLLVALTMCVAATSASAAVIAYDGFSSANYTTGQLLGQNPTITGFTGAWTNNAVVYEGGAASALTYNGIASNDTGGAFSNSVGGRTGRVFSTMLGGNVVSGTHTYYISLMIKNAVINVANYRAFELDSQFGNRNFQLGSAADTGFTNWGMRVTTATSTNIVANSGVAAVANSTVFAVVKLTYSDVAAGDSVSLWIDPTNLGSESLSTNFVSLTGFDFLHNSARDMQLASFSGAGTSYWDEIRIGTAWADVTPVPEPSAFVLFGIGSLCFVAMRARIRHKFKR